MDNGIYSAVFKSSIEKVGGCLLVIDNGKIHGGTTRYIIKGFYERKGDTTEAELKIEHYQGPLKSVFGEIEEYSLILSVTPEPGSFQMKGYMIENADMKIEVEGIKVSDLVSAYP